MSSKNDYEDSAQNYLPEILSSQNLKEEKIKVYFNHDQRSKEMSHLNELTNKAKKDY